MNPQMLDWESRYFGFGVARLTECGEDELNAAMDTCQKEKVALVICRFSTDNISFAHNLERRGFQLMDAVTRCRMYFAGGIPLVKDGLTTVRYGEKSEASLLAEMASTIYNNHNMSHFHNDPRLDRDQCNNLYAELIRNSCVKEGFADLILVAETDGEIVGFHSHRILNDGLSGVVSGVSQKAQGHGVGKALILASAKWGSGRGLKWIEEYPHINNYPMHNIMHSLGFRIQATSYTFHKWFDING